MSWISRSLSRLGSKEFARNVSVLMAGTLGAHLISVAGIPITARLFSPEAFSILAVYSAILSILLTLATLSLHIGIPVADTHQRALGLVSGAGVVLLANTMLLTLVLLTAGDLIIGLLNRPDFVPYLFLLVPGLLLGGGYAALQMWFSRRKNFGLVSRTRVMRSAGGTGTQLAFGFAGGGTTGLILGHLLYAGVGVFALLRRFIQDERTALKRLARADIVDSLRRNKGYVYCTTPENIANVAAIQLPVLVIAANQSTGEVGHLYLAQTVMMLPMMLIGSSVGQVFIAEAPQHHRDGKLWPFTKHVFRGLALTGVPLLIFVGLLAPVLAGPILGQDWTYTGVLIAWMTPWMILQFLCSPLSTIFYVVGRQGLAMVLQFFGLALRLGAVILAISFSPENAMPVYALSGATFYLIMIIVIIDIARKSR